MIEKETKITRGNRVTVRYNAEEMKQIKRLLQATTCQKISDYIRKTSLHKPVTVFYRNQSADEFLAEMIGLKNELNAIGNNFNQAVHKLHTLDTVPEVKTWILLNESLKKSFLKKTEEIKEKLTEIHRLWLQK